jgi:hypothetical protein
MAVRWSEQPDGRGTLIGEPAPDRRRALDDSARDERVIRATGYWSMEVVGELPRQLEGMTRDGSHTEEVYAHERGHLCAHSWPPRSPVLVPHYACVRGHSDLGRSGKSTDGRDGFQGLVADVGLGRVGIVLGIEVPSSPAALGESRRRRRRTPSTDNNPHAAGHFDAHHRLWIGAILAHRFPRRADRAAHRHDRGADRPFRVGG